MTVAKIRLGMVGGGQGAFIGAVHRIAARLDNRYELVAAALSADAKRATESAAEVGIASARSYTDFRVMAKKEASRKDGIEAVVIVTPNHLHFDAARAFLEAGIHVICDKPLTSTLEDAEILVKLVAERDLLFAVTYNYSGYPMVREAREMISAGALGAIRVIQIEYAQDWLATNIETTGQKQATWRTDPARAGAGGAIGDIGSHAFHLSEFLSGLEVTSLLADLDAFLAGRTPCDNPPLLPHFNNGATAMLWVRPVATGSRRRRAPFGRAHHPHRAHGLGPGVLQPGAHQNSAQRMGDEMHAIVAAFCHRVRQGLRHQFLDRGFSRRIAHVDHPVALRL